MFHDVTDADSQLYPVQKKGKALEPHVGGCGSSHWAHVPNELGGMDGGVNNGVSNHGSVLLVDVEGHSCALGLAVHPVGGDEVLEVDDT